jgi:hypothetical chaperone protein
VKKDDSVMTAPSRRRAAGLDFGTTNTVAATVAGDGMPHVVATGDDADGVFRSALCFWQDDAHAGGLAVEGGPGAIREYLAWPQDSRFLQSFKSVAASATFDTASIFDRRYRFEDLGRLFLDRLATAAGGALNGLDRIVVGRPVEYAGGRPDAALARRRYDAMFAGFAGEVHYAYEPLAAAFGHAVRLEEPATLLVADFGGGTSDFSVVQVAEPAAARRCIPLGHAGIGLAGDRFDQRILDRLVLPLLGKGGSYRSFGKILDIPSGYFAEFGEWSRLALMRNRRTLADLEKLRRSAVDPDAIGRMIAVIENELGFPLYDAVGRLKRALSRDERATFTFSGAGLEIDAIVTRDDFEGWIADDLARIAATVDRALVVAKVDAGAIDSVFLTGGTSLVPAVRSIFERRFGAARIATGGELTAIAHGLALIAAEEDSAGWTS